VEVLSPDDAQKLLLKIAPRVGKKAEEIAILCGCLPLALELAASALVKYEDLTPEEYTRSLSDEKQRLKHLEPVEAALTVSYGLLNENEPKLWRTLAVFPDTFDALGAAAVWGIEHNDAKEAISVFVARSMTEWRKDTGRYRLHDLVRIFADSKLSDEERREAQGRHAECYREVLAVADNRYLEGGEKMMAGLALFDLEWGNIQAGQGWATTHAEEDDALAKLCSAYPDAGAYVLDLRQHPRERISWLKAGLAAARRLKNRQAEGIHLGNLGLAYWALGEPRRAIEFYEQDLVIAREIGDRRGEGAVLGNLGSAYLALGDPRRAIEFYEQDLVIAREIGNRRGEGAVLGNLGLAYADLGEPRRAIEFYEQHLTIAREIGDRRGEGNALGNLGSAYLALGETRRAIEFYEKALEIDREIGDRRGEGQDLGNLGIAYRHLGETRRAIEFYEQALEIDREIGDRRGEGQDLGNLGNAYFVLGETRQAIKFYKQQLVITSEIGDRRGEGSALFNMSLALDVLGKREEAIRNAEAALKIFEQIEDPNAAKVRRQLEEWT
jgi:tetratricopeptide (TPR) repeat protein